MRDPAIKRKRTGQVAKPIIMNKYELHDLIAKGGTGNVYHGIRIITDEPVAIKIINKKEVESPSDLKRMRRGIMACSLMNHPNIIKIYDYGQTDVGEPAIIMEYVNGDTLKNILEKQGPMDITTTISILKQVAEALNYAHSKGIVHRDIKPDNIMLEPHGNDYRVTLADFGVARWFKGGKRLKNPTVKGIAVGTPSYMSPEQINGLTDIDGRADIYGLGVVAYEMLTGKNPFRRKKMIDILKAHLFDSTPAFPEEIVKTMPIALLKVIQRMLNKDRSRRIQSAAALLKALSTI